MGKSNTVVEFDSDNSTMEKGLNAKRKRALRNRERLLNHKMKLLDNFAAGVNMGFSEENWNSLAKLFAQVSDFLAPVERQWLGQVWRESYTSEVSPTKIEEAVTLVKTRLMTPQNRRSI